MEWEEEIMDYFLVVIAIKDNNDNKVTIHMVNQVMHNKHSLNKITTIKLVEP